MPVFNRIEFVVSEALTAFTRNRLMMFAAVSTVAIALFLLGGMGYAYYRIDRYAQSIPGKFRMVVYLRDEATQKDVQDTAAKVRSIAGVASVAWIPKDKAWDRWKKDLPAELTTGVDNPLPEGLRVILTDLKKSDDVVASIKAIPTVAPKNGVRYMREEQNLVDGILVGLKLFGGVVGGILLVLAGILIHNAIRLTVLSRRLEIRIMQLVGASRPTVYVPFLIEGMIQGIVGGILAAGLVFGAYHGFNWMTTTMVPIGYTPAPFPYVGVFGILTAAGAIYGILCSTAAIRAPLKYR